MFQEVLDGFTGSRGIKGGHYRGFLGIPDVAKHSIGSQGRFKGVSGTFKGVSEGFRKSQGCLREPPEI